ncbi:MAG TPA: hypothetical protein VES01_09835 [Dermatophilaceae bacterium]|nr:hypothetical protein [Dermatophilaceae bacterium]
MLIAGIREQRLDARQIAHQPGRNPKVAVTGRHLWHIEIHCAQQHRVSTDQGQ